MSLEKNKMGGVDEKKEDKEGVGREWKTIISNIFFVQRRFPGIFVLNAFLESVTEQWKSRDWVVYNEQ